MIRFLVATVAVATFLWLTVLLLTVIWPYLILGAVIVFVLGTIGGIISAVQESRCL
jgi:hypothetical protein